MDFSSPHLGFVAASYGLFATVLLAVLVYAIWRGKNLRRELHDRGLKDIGHTSVEPDKKP